MREKFEVIAHRGSGLGRNNIFKPNRLSSIRNAFEKGADFVEVDLRLTADEKLVLHHNNYVHPSFFKRKSIKKLSLKKVKEFEKQIVSFEHLLYEFPNKRFYLDIKGHQDFKSVFDKTYKLIEKNKDHFVFTSFSPYVLNYIKSVDPKLYCSFIATGDYTLSPFVRDKHIQYSIDHGFDEVGGYWLTFSKKKVRRAKKAGLNVMTGYINNRFHLWQIIKKGVNRIHTNNIDFFWFLS